jgi:hypothetical protein
LPYLAIPDWGQRWCYSSNHDGGVEGQDHSQVDTACNAHPFPINALLFPPAHSISIVGIALAEGTSQLNALAERISGETEIKA